MSYSAPACAGGPGAGIAGGIDARGREVFRRLVECYLERGEPVGSQTLARLGGGALSSATIRSVLSDLCHMGLVEAPHSSSGRLPTATGLRFYVDGLLEIGPLDRKVRRDLGTLEEHDQQEPSLARSLEWATRKLADLSRCAGLVSASRSTGPGRLSSVRLAPLREGRMLAILEGEDGHVENRIFTCDVPVPEHVLGEANAYLADRVRSCTLEEAQALVEEEIAARRTSLSRLADDLIARGIAQWRDTGGREQDDFLLVRGQDNLLADVSVPRDLERIRSLFREIEGQRCLWRLIESTRHAEGVRIFIGAESDLFSATGCSAVIASCRDEDGTILGAAGVIGPMWMNYGRMVPLVNVTAAIVGRIVRTRANRELH